MHTPNDNPRLRVNRFPWNARASNARLHLEAFLRGAERHVEGAPPGALPFPPVMGRRVLAWLLGRLDTPPGQD